MKSEKTILIAFVLNVAFSVLECIGGIVTGSIAIVSDAVHDLGDAAGIGVAYFMERKSRRQPDGKYTYGYARYSVLGSVITTLILLLGSVAVIGNAIGHISAPAEIRYDGMIGFAVVGVAVNVAATLVTRTGESLNQKTVTLHLLEDVLGWIVVLIGAVVMYFTDWVLLDPLLSIGVAAFIVVKAVRNLDEALAVFLEKVPCGVDGEEIMRHLQALDGVAEVHHLHLWSLDGQTHCATVHIVSNDDTYAIKEQARAELLEYGIGHVTLEMEREDEPCCARCCRAPQWASAHCHHHH